MDELYRDILPDTVSLNYRGVAQLVARTAGGREVAGSSPVTPTIQNARLYVGFFEW